jgi:glycerophosphoryl diester phosphodiesterase
MIKFSTNLVSDYKLQIKNTKYKISPSSYAYLSPMFWGLICLFTVACDGGKAEREKENRVSTIKNPPMDELFNQEVFDLQGHRGARGLLPENSIPAFLKAIDWGVKTLELDVVVSKDSQIVISHEPFFSAEICLNAQGDTIKKEQEKKYNIYQMTLAEIKKFDCGSIGNPRFPEQKKQRVFKPTLREMVNAVEKYLAEKKLKPVFYNIETKSLPEGDSIFHPAPTEFAQLLYDEIKALKILDRVYIQSFDVRTLQAFKKIDEEVPLVLLVENKNSLRDNLEKLGFTPSVYSPYYQLVTLDLVKQAHELGMKVIPWTVNEESAMENMKKMGVDGLITDYPNRFKKGK